MSKKELLELLKLLDDLGLMLDYQADGARFAIKRHYCGDDPSIGVRVDTLRELRAQRELTHPNVLSVVHAYLDGAGSLHTVRTDSSAALIAGG